MIAKISLQSTAEAFHATRSVGVSGTTAPRSYWPCRSAEQTALYRFIEAPAEGPRGVLVKITAFIEEIEVVGMDTRMLETIRSDLERLAEEARS